MITVFVGTNPFREDLLGIFVSIICRVREIIWIVIGILLMKLK